MVMYFNLLLPFDPYWFRERIIHLLALKPQKRSDIVTRLKKGEGGREGRREGGGGKEGRRERREGGRKEGGREGRKEGS